MRSSELDTINGQQVIAGLGTGARRRQRRAQEGAPAITLIDGFQAVAIIINFKISAQQAYAGAGSLVDISAANPIMANLQLGNHLNQHFVQILAPLHVGQHWLIFIVNPLPVDTMQCRIVEIFQLHPPGIIKDLLPLGGRIDKAAHLT